MAVSFSLFISRVSLFPSSLSRERVSVEPFFSPLPASSYPYHPAPTPPYRTSSSYLLFAFALLFSKYPCGVFSAKAAFREDLIPLFFCAWAAWVLWFIYVRGWVSWLVGWLGAGFSCELRLVQQTALRTQAAACSIERAGGRVWVWVDGVEGVCRFGRLKC